MLIKQADDHSEELAQLERLAKSDSGQAAKHATHDLAIRKAGIKGEKDSTYEIHFYYEPSPNWAVIHDLRLELNGRTAQIDHLLINRWLECYVLESKHFHAGIKITEEGEFLRWNDYKHTYEGIPSPLLQNERHIAVLRDVMKNLELPTRLGLRIPFAFQSFVLVSSSARIDRPDKFDTSHVIKAEQLKERLERDFDKENAFVGMVKTAAKIVSSDTVRDVAQQLVNRHRPMKWPMPAMGDVAAAAIAKPAAVIASVKATDAVMKIPVEMPQTPAPTTQATPTGIGPQCKDCHSCVGSILYGKYGYYFQCAQCHANTAIKFTCLPGHKPRLRKAGDQFYRDCAECHSSELYFTNS